MKSKTKVKKIYDKFIKLNISEICLAGLIMGLHLISSKFLTINLSGMMKIGISFVFIILYGLVFGPIKGIVIALIADNFSLLINGGAGQWIWQYAIIPIGIVLTSWFFKYTFKYNGFIWWLIMLALNFFIIAGIIVVFVLNHLYSYTKAFDKKVDIIIYIILSLMFIIQMTLFTIFKSKGGIKIKQTLSMVTLIIFVIVIWMWLWGPIAYIAWLKHLGSIHVTHLNYAGYYKIYLISRILKTPIIIPIYTIILIPIYKAIEIIKNNNYKWK